MALSQLIWLVIALPIIGVLFNGLLGRRVGYPVVRFVGPAVIGLAFLVGVGIFFETLMRGGEPVTVELWTWATIGSLNIPISLLVDPLSVVMTLVITGVGFLIHVYATDYMVHHHGDEVHPDRDFTRFFTFLNLFVASMLVLVLGDNYLMMFIGWELVGACSYLLIGFWYDRGEDPQEPIEIEGKDPVYVPPLLSPAASGMKAFVVNRIGDVGFALGIFLIWSSFGTLQYLGESGVFANAEHFAESHPQVIGWIAFLLFIGAMGKSAQIPLYVWLPDAMAGPTPVSALIHAATMVTAGIYMIVRSHVIYMLAPNVSMLVAFVGAFTALGAASIALVQVDLKRVLAYSTVSQLGYMFMAVGVAATVGTSAYVAGMFHLVTHAFFKALLFLGAGSVMHALHDVIDIRRMGGLKKKMPITYWTFVIGGLALAGFPLTSGFFSKDEILLKAFEASFFLWLIGAITAALTAFYTFRAIFIAFHGEPRDQELFDHAHESRSPITIPLMILAALAAFAGFMGLPYPILNEIIPGTDSSLNLFKTYLDPMFITLAHPPHVEHLSFGLELFLLVFSGVIAISGIGVAYYLYVLEPEIPKTIANVTRPGFKVLLNKYYVDEIYDATIVAATRWLAKGMAAIDRFVIDGIIDGSAKAVRQLGQLTGTLQTGYTSQYALATFIGVLVLISYFIIMGGW